MIQANPIHRASVLILDTDRILLRSLAQQLRSDAYAVSTSDNYEHATRELAGAPIDIVLADLDGQSDSIAALRELRQSAPDAAIIVTTRYGAIERAAEATRAGAFAYLTKPFTEENIRRVIDKAVRQQALVCIDSDRTTSTKPPGLQDIVGRDLQMQKVFDVVDAVADTRTNVLIVGESGTGKSMLARALHRRSARRAKPFVEVSCGALPDLLLESELFGHVKGSFTGAIADKPGRFVSADTGTIFLDEINSAPPPMQVKLLRVLQERALEPVGSSETRIVDVRAILASNVDLESLVAAGTFRQDLYYRINVITIRLPALRERTGDIPALANFFLKRFAHDLNRQVLGFTPGAMDRLVHHPWPGNVRELENVIERAVVLSKRPIIGEEDLPESWHTRRAFATPAPGATENTPALPLETALQEPERRIIQAALARNAWNRQATAAELDINRTTLYKKMRKHGLDVGENN